MDIHIESSDVRTVKTFLKDFYIPPEHSHKGQNGKALIIGGSHLFHAAYLWAAEAASYYIDMLHFASTQENNSILIQLKSQFRNGIVIEQKDIPWYAEEDDAILIGPGMVRAETVSVEDESVETFEKILEMQEESDITYHITRYLMTKFPHKRFVLDAGALQMMDAEWLKQMKQTPIICPHQLEFERLFGKPVRKLSMKDKIRLVKELAAEYKCVIVLKAVADIISDGKTVVVVEGGNPGLTKGGSGDVLGGVMTAFYTKNNALTSAVVASYIMKRTADILSEDKGYWYNISNLIDKMPATLKQLVDDRI